MEPSNKEPEKRGTTTGGTTTGGTLIPDHWAEVMREKLSAGHNGPFSAVMTPVKPNPGQPFNEGAEAYLHGVLAAMCAGVCESHAIYKPARQDTAYDKIVVELRTFSGSPIFISVDLPFGGAVIRDDWFLELKARIVMECGE